MKAVSVAYHDAVVGNAFEASGFPGDSANSYKLDIEQLKQHLSLIAANGNSSVVSEFGSLGGDKPGDVPLYLTFDDGGLSASEYIADALESLGCLGHFFIATDFIGKPAFMSVSQIRELSERGHMIGSHSCSHPPNIAKLADDEIFREWQESVDVLSSITGKQTTCASVPRGYNSANVVEGAERAGVTELFTSEPSKNVASHGRCNIFGRFALKRGDTAAKAAALASVSPSLAQLKQSAYWGIKKVAKRSAGPMYESVRQWKLRKNATSVRN